MKTTSIFTAGLFLISAGLVASCALETSNETEPVARVTLNVARVPAQVSCIVVDMVSYTGARDERSFTVTPGAGWAEYVEGLPTGNVTFQGFAYAVSCAERDANVPSWATSTSSVALAQGVPANVILAFHPNSLPRTPVDPGTCVAEPCGAPTDTCGTGVVHSNACAAGFIAAARCVLGPKATTCDAACACEPLPKCTPGQPTCAGAANVLADFVIPEGTCTAKPCAAPNGAALCAPAELESAACVEGTVAVPRCTLGPKGTTCDSSCACEPVQ